MPPYANIISRSDASALMPEDLAAAILTKATEQSAAMRLFRRIPASREQVRIRVLSALPTAYWVNGDTGLKQSTEANWANKFLNVEELAAIVPIPQNVVDDVDFDMVGEIRPLVSEAIGRAFDAAVFFGTNKPASFPSDVVTAATAAGNAVAEAAAAAAGGFMGDFDAMVALLEDDGYDLGGVVAVRSAKAKLRAARGTTGEQLDRDRVDPQLTSIDGAPIAYPMRGLFPSNIRLIGLDPSEFVLAVRKDITMDVFREGVIQDNAGAIIYNLLQQDMIALRFTFRGGWQVGNVINNDKATEADRYPAAVLTH